MTQDEVDGPLARAAEGVPLGWLSVPVFCGTPLWS
jgi:hypothetical protein